VRQNIEVPPLDPAEYILLRVCNEEDENVHGITISQSSTLTGTGWDGGGFHYRTSTASNYLRRPDGAYILLHSEWRNSYGRLIDEAVELDIASRLTIQAEDYKTEKVSYRPGELHEMTVRLTRKDQNK
jgi:hypothetical protein